MTDDFKPVSENPLSDPLPFDEEVQKSMEDFPYSAEDVISEADYGSSSYNGTEAWNVPTPKPATENLPDAKVPTQPIWARIRRSVFGATNRIGDPDFMARIHDLDRAIVESPNTPGNYVLRGELYLSAKEYTLAQIDFIAGWDLAVKQFERSDWGIMAQTMQDRALVGLQKAERRLKAIDDRFRP